MAERSPPVAELQNVVTDLGGTDPETRINPNAAEALRAVFADASLVALGEASHGARAQFRVKSRLVRFLVEELDVRAFALEVDANWARKIDRYVVDGEGDVEDILLSARISWPWKTAELVNLFEWMRTFNEERPAEDRLRVYGFDTASFDRVADTLTEFFDTVDADVDGVRDDVDALADEDEDVRVDAAESVIDTLPPLFDENEGWKSRCSDRTFTLARRQPDLLAQTLKFYRADTQDRFALRDEAMAENASWIIDSGGAKRAVLWAHNLHVARLELSGEMSGFFGRTMGDQLAARYGDDYVSVGLGLGGGEYLAVDAETMEPVSPSVPSPPAKSIPDVFLRLDMTTPFVSTTALREHKQTDEWLTTTPQRHHINGMVEDGESLTYVASDLSEFDAFAFVRTTDPTNHLGVDG